MSRPRAGGLARTGVPVCGPNDMVRDVDRSMGVAVVVDRERVVVGMLREEGLGSDPASRVEDVMICAPSTFRTYVPIEEMADYMTAHDLDSSRITTSDGRLAGVLVRADALRASRR